MKKKFISLEFNEIKFDYIEKYIKIGHLPNFKYLFDKYGYLKTISEEKYNELEPWIQWVTVHTGLTYNEHKIFRLGEGAMQNHKQIWEAIEEKGYSAAAVSPMNARNNLKNSPCFIPDPWTQTPCTGNKLVQNIYEAICQAVNDNAKSKITFKSKVSLLCGLIYSIKPNSIKDYVALFSKIKSSKWSKALILDRLLTDIFIKSWKTHTPDYATLFLNAGAHIQHHYMYSSSAYEGEIKNPSWYISDNKDPLLELYELYDNILGEFIKLAEENKIRLSLVTALGQKPYLKNAYYYRLKEHERFLRKMKINYQRIEPQMSRDFTIYFADPNESAIAATILNNIFDINGDALFYVDNQGQNLFVMLIYPKEITKDFIYVYNKAEYKNFYNDIVFVAIKNSEHETQAFYLDTGINIDDYPKQIPLKELFNITKEHFTN